MHTQHVKQYQMVVEKCQDEVDALREQERVNKDLVCVCMCVCVRMCVDGCVMDVCMCVCSEDVCGWMCVDGCVWMDV